MGFTANPSSLKTLYPVSWCVALGHNTPTNCSHGQLRSYRKRGLGRGQAEEKYKPAQVRLPSGIRRGNPVTQLWDCTNLISSPALWNKKKMCSQEYGYDQKAQVKQQNAGVTWALNSPDEQSSLCPYGNCWESSQSNQSAAGFGQTDEAGAGKKAVTAHTALVSLGFSSPSPSSPKQLLKKLGYVLLQQEPCNAELGKLPQAHVCHPIRTINHSKGHCSAQPCSANTASLAAGLRSTPTVPTLSPLHQLYQLVRGIHPWNVTFPMSQDHQHH